MMISAYEMAWARAGRLFPIQLLYAAIPIPQLHSNPFRIFLPTDKLMILMITVKIGTALMQY